MGPTRLARRRRFGHLEGGVCKCDRDGEEAQVASMGIPIGGGGPVMPGAILIPLWAAVGANSV